MESSYFQHQDLTEDFSEATGRPWSPKLAFLAALALIKARLVSKSDVAQSQFENFLRFLAAENATISLSKSSPVVDRIRRYVVPCFGEQLQKQKIDFENLLDQIDGENRIFLSAIVNPEPLLSQGQVSPLFLTIFLITYQDLNIGNLKKVQFGCPVFRLLYILSCRDLTQY